MSKCPKCTTESMYTTCPCCGLDKKQDDPINSPPHYIFGPYETIDIIEAWLRANDIGEPAALSWGSMVQYIFRYHKKKGKQDLEKAKFYLERLINGYDRD